MGFCGVFKRKGLQCLLVIFLVFLCFILLSPTAHAADEASTLPHVVKWVNGFAVSDSGIYLSDTWAVDDTGVSSKKYVLLGQGSEEVMRIENYPEDLTDGDTAPCEKYSMTISLDLPDGVSGDVYITLENAVAEYSVTFSEENGYQAVGEFYPGVYEITDVELASDVKGAYRVGNYHQIDVSSDLSVSLEVTKAGADAEAGPGADVAPGNSADSGSAGSATEDNNELWSDTIKLFVVVSVLFGIYAVIKYRRQKSEEMKQ